MTDKENIALAMKNFNKAAVFLIPPQNAVNGGIMSIFTLCKSSRDILKDHFVSLVTYPGKETYSKNTKFGNEEAIFSFGQLVQNGKKLESLLLHIPDYFAKDFIKSLSDEEIKFLRSVPDLRLNIMNQNLELMPSFEQLENLKTLASEITQTIAHDRYSSQAICDMFGMPTHLFSASKDYSKYPVANHAGKNKVIAISNDRNPHRKKILHSLETNLPDWKIVEINNMTFDAYMETITNAMFTITFGEGFDGYFIEPAIVGSVGLAVYNDAFFPNAKWKKMANVYADYDDMLKNIARDIKNLSNNPREYDKLAKNMLDEINKIYPREKYVDNLERFYNKKYDFMPNRNKYIDDLKSLLTALSNRRARADEDIKRANKSKRKYKKLFQKVLCAAVAELIAIICLAAL
jgi:hypothetical protein